MKTCPQCEKENPSSANYCMYCGTALVEEEQLSEEAKLFKKLKEQDEEIRLLKAALEAQLKKEAEQQQEKDTVAERKTEPPVLPSPANYSNLIPVKNPTGLIIGGAVLVVALLVFLITVLQKNKDNLIELEQTQQQLAQQQSANEELKQEQKRKEQQAKEQQRREQQAKEQQAKEQQTKEQQAKEQQAKEQQAKEQQAKEQQAKEQQAKESIVETVKKTLARNDNLPPLTISNIVFGSTDRANNIVISYGSTLYASDIKYLTARLSATCNLSESENVKFYIKIFAPDGKLIRGSNSPAEYTWLSGQKTIPVYPERTTVTLPGFGDNAGGYFAKGQHRYEIWYEYDGKWYSESKNVTVK
jgi:DNA polymerase III alpha subunit (gram-positive type)